MAFAGNTTPIRNSRNAVSNANSLLNPTALATLPDASSSGGRIEAVLLEYDIEGKKEKALWHFLVNPATLKYSDSADYNEVSPLASKVKVKQYSSSSGLKLKISDLLFSVYCLGKSLRPLTEGIDALLKAKTEENQFAPPVLMFRWGSKRFAPCVLIDVEWDESAWLGGEAARVKMSLTLEEIPKPLTTAEIEAKKKTKGKADQEKRSQAGKPPLKLTERQRKEASDKAKEYLKANTQNWTADVQAAIEKGYKLATDAETGDVTMFDAKGKKLGVVLRSLGDKQQIANDKITTIPLKKDAKIPELKAERSM
jgi:hypothetical protein